MQSKDSKVFKTIKKDEIFNFGEHEILAVDLNGHTYNHLGYIVNGVLFSGDAVISEDNLSKTKMSYYVDVEKLMDSINLLSKLEYELILPSHGKHSEKNKELLNYNREKIALINRLIIDITKEEINEEDLFSKVFTELDMNIRTTTEFFLMRSTLMAHISYLSDKNKIKIIVKNNRIYYKAV
jgi:glyoxylase-like metal-dependent hydrolase (beta-lactamase superfamily II)